MTRTLVVNADDFGFTRDVNEGIVHAHRHGILTATTLMATGAAFDHAVALAREKRRRSTSAATWCWWASAGFPPTVAALDAARWRSRRIRIYDELRAQIQRILDAGIRPTHLDTHKHTHLLPPVLDAVAAALARSSASRGCAARSIFR